MDRGNITVICNLSQSERPLPLPAPSQLLLASSSTVHVNEAAAILPSDTVAIVRTNRTSVDDAGENPLSGSD
jgi:hypothetical protein